MKKKIIIGIIIFIAGLLFFFGCEEFLRRKIGGFAGSYPFAVSWDLKATEREVVDAIIELKRENPDIQPANQIEYFSKRDTGYIWNSSEMKDYLKKLEFDSLAPLPKKNWNNYYHDYWLIVEFYYQDTKEIVRTWTRPDNDTTTTTFAFVSLSKAGNKFDNRLINRDFGFFENRRQINKFERNFVDKIKVNLNKKKKSGA
jgi:hypothetical protein